MVDLKRRDKNGNERGKGEKGEKKKTKGSKIVVMVDKMGNGMQNMIIYWKMFEKPSKIGPGKAFKFDGTIYTPGKN